MATNQPGQLSLLEEELLPQGGADQPLVRSSGPSPRPVARRVEWQGPELDAAMRAVWSGWRRWHRCKSFDEAVADPVTHRLLLLTVTRGPLGRR